MLRKIGGTKIATRFVASFVVIIAIFSAYIILSGVLRGEVSRRYQHNIDFMMARTEIIFSFHQEFTEMRRVIRASFMSPEWRDTADYELWRAYERRICESFLRLADFSDRYIESITADEFFPRVENDRRAVLMKDIMADIESLYESLRENFFINGDMNFDHVDLPGYAAAADAKINEMRYIIAANQAANLAAIEQTENFMEIVTLVTIILSLTVSVFLAYMMIKTFTDKIKAIKIKAEQVAEGVLDVEQISGTDEISQVFAAMATDYATLSYQIKNVADENERGNSHARIDTNLFKTGSKTLAEIVNSMLDAVSEAQRRELESGERTHLLFESAPIVMEIWNKDLEMIESNSFALKLLGIEPPAEYIYTDFIPPTQPDGADSHEYLRLNLRKIFECNHHSFNLTMHDTTGRTIYLEVIGVLMVIDGEIAALTYSSDVTRIKESMDKLAASEEHKRLILDGNPSACYLIEADLTVLYCNSSAISLFGFADKKEAMENSVEMFISSNEEAFKKEYDTVMQEGYYTFEREITKPDGVTIPCEFTLVRLDIDNKQTIAVYIKDMTSLKQMLVQQERMRAAEEANRAKSKFLTTMSHEIRTPITAVMGIAEIQLQNPSLRLELEEAFTKIYDSANILLNIINDLLDISKIEAGKMELSISEYQITSLVTDTMQLRVAYIGSKMIDIKIEADEDMPSFLLGDELRLKQIINNLLSNAFKYTDKGHVKLSLFCDYADKSEGCHLNIIVEDTGVGMTKKQLASLVTEYSRFHEKTNPEAQGTGLGMSIAHNLVALMGGSMNVKSKRGIGTSVHIRVPQTALGASKLGKEMADNLRKLDFSRLSGFKMLNFKPEPMPYGSVLIVDDTDANIYVAKGLMSLYNLDIETATSGIAAINKINEGNVYDIIFMDYMMPEMNGIDATKIIRHMGYSEPIVALTANALVGQSVEFLQNGFDGFVSKPIKTTHLNAVLKKFIRDKQPPDVIEEARASLDDESGIGKYGGLLADIKLINRLHKDFYRTQKNVMPQLYSAYEARDYEKARLLAHTLRSLAGLIGEKNLVNAAGRVEENVEAQMDSAALLSVLEDEFTSVLSKVSEQLEEESTEAVTEFDKEAASKLLDELAALLSENSGDVEKLMDSLKKIPHTEDLTEKIMDFEYTEALEEIKILREKLNI